MTMPTPMPESEDAATLEAIRRLAMEVRDAEMDHASKAEAAKVAKKYWESLSDRLTKLCLDQIKGDEEASRPLIAAAEKAAGIGPGLADGTPSDARAEDLPKAKRPLRPKAAETEA